MKKVDEKGKNNRLFKQR